MENPLAIRVLRGRDALTSPGAPSTKSGGCCYVPRSAAGPPRFSRAPRRTGSRPTNCPRCGWMGGRRILEQARALSLVRAVSRGPPYCQP